MVCPLMTQSGQYKENIKLLLLFISPKAELPIGRSNSVTKVTTIICRLCYQLALRDHATLENAHKKQNFETWASIQGAIWSKDFYPRYTGKIALLFERREYRYVFYLCDWSGSHGRGCV